MSTERDEGKRAHHGLFVLNVEDRKLFAFVAALLLVAVVGTGTLSCASLKISNRVSKNSAAIASQQRSDTIRARRSDARICSRENLVRAEVHVAYQSGQPMPPPEKFANEPILQVLLSAARANQQGGLKRVRRNLPILGCAPNLKGRPAYALPEKKQKRFVELYEDSKLDPTPSARDAQVGPAK